MCHVNRPVFHAQGQTQRRSNNRRGSNKQKSYTVDFIKKTLIFWIHWNHQLISTTQLQSNKESTDHWWLSVKKTEANFLQNWLLAKQRRTQVVQGQWDRGGVFQRTDKYPLTSNILLAGFKLRRTARSNVSRPWLKKKNKIENRRCYGAEEAEKFEGSSNWLQRFKKRHNILLRRRTNKKNVWADDGRDTIQKFNRDLRKALKTQRRSNKSYTVDPKYGRWIPKNRYNIDLLGSCPICKWVR